MADNPLPFYYRTYEFWMIRIEPAYAGCLFEVVASECKMLPVITLLHTPGHSVGHMALSVATLVHAITPQGREAA